MAQVGVEGIVLTIGVVQGLEVAELAQTVLRFPAAESGLGDVICHRERVLQMGFWVSAWRWVRQGAKQV